jgi:heat shock protein HslJ
MRLVRFASPLLVLLSSVSLLAGCGEAPAGSRAPADPLRGVTFLSDEVTVAGKPHALVDQTRVSLDFTDDGRLIASAGCNTISGPVSTERGRLAVDELASTEMGCDKSRQAQDEWLAGVLGERPAWRLDGPELTVRAGDTTLVLTDREVAEPDLSLVATRWTVDTLLNGQTASSVPAGETATLVFDDKKVRIDAGCNGGSADYTMTGDQIRFGRATMTLMACPDSDLEAAVLDVVRDTVTFEIDGGTMTLNHPSGKGLRLHAQ